MVIRGCVREGRLTFDGKLTIAWYSIIWLDPVGNYVRPQFMFNAYYVNRGSWVEGIPVGSAPTAATSPTRCSWRSPPTGWRSWPRSEPAA